MNFHFFPSGNDAKKHARTPNINHLCKFLELKANFKRTLCLVGCVYGIFFSSFVFFTVQVRDSIKAYLIYIQMSLSATIQHTSDVDTMIKHIHIWLFNIYYSMCCMKRFEENSINFFAIKTIERLESFLLFYYCLSDISCVAYKITNSTMRRNGFYSLDFWSIFWHRIAFFVQIANF